MAVVGRPNRGQLQQKQTTRERRTTWTDKSPDAHRSTCMRTKRVSVRRGFTRVLHIPSTPIRRPVLYRLVAAITTKTKKTAAAAATAPTPPPLAPHSNRLLLPAQAAFLVLIYRPTTYLQKQARPFNRDHPLTSSVQKLDMLPYDSFQRQPMTATPTTRTHQNDPPPPPFPPPKLTHSYVDVPTTWTGFSKPPPQRLRHLHHPRSSPQPPPPAISLQLPVVA